MKITASVEYAMQALLEIAAHDGSPVSAHLISEEQGIPLKYLESILRKLTQAAILTSTRGPQGGYQLSRPLNRINVADVIRVIEGPLAAVGNRAPEAAKYRHSAKHLTDVWIATRVALRDVLEQITLDDIFRGEFDPKIRQALRRKDAWSRRTE